MTYLEMMTDIGKELSPCFFLEVIDALLLS